MMSTTDGTMPALFLGHGAPPLLEDPTWTTELRTWARDLPRPTGILIVSAHWEAAPILLTSSAAATPLVYDFSGFDDKYYRMTYPTPEASELATVVTSMFPANEPVHEQTNRGLDHGAWVPLKVMYPDADIPVLQMSIPTFDPQYLMRLGARLRPLRDQGILIIGSGFLTHGLPYLRDWRVDATPPGWSVDFDLWAEDALKRGDIETLAAYQTKGPGMPYAHPTVEHFVPLFITLGAASDPEAGADSVIDGYFMGLAKRSFQMA
jgi:4,5-DOPA dioxygenase extradiol